MAVGNDGLNMCSFHKHIQFTCDFRWYYPSKWFFRFMFIPDFCRHCTYRRDKKHLICHRIYVLYLIHKPDALAVWSQQLSTCFIQGVFFSVSMLTKMISTTNRHDFHHSEGVVRQDVSSQLQRTSECQELCAAFLDTTSAHGLPRVRTEFGRVRKVLWALMFVGLTIVCCQQSSILMEKFLQYDVYVAVHIINK